METTDHSNDRPGGRFGRFVLGALNIIVWIATAILGLVDIYLSREIALSIYANFSTNLNPANQGPALLVSTVVVLITALIWLGYAFGSIEYILKHVGQPRSWTLVGWAAAIELLILILYFVA